MAEYNVFLSHNSKDKPEVVRIAEALKAYDLSVWMDEWEIIPGTSIQGSIEKGLLESKSVAVFVGPTSLGQWEEPEFRIAISQQVTRKISVIPVFLPGVTQELIDRLSPFLTNNRWVDFRNGLNDPEALFNLRWGITGIRPDPLNVAAVSRPLEETVKKSLVDETVDDLVQSLKSQNVTFFLGPGASHNNAPARACDIARELLADLRIIQPDYKWLLPPIDIAGMYYSVRSSDQRLETKVVNLMADFPQAVSPTQKCLASLLQLLSKRPTRRMRGNRRQLIVTTNLNVMTERALLSAGLPFTRIVQHRSGDQITVNEYNNAKLIEPNVLELPGPGAPLRVRLDDLDALDTQIQTYGAKVYRAKDGQGSGENPLHSLPVQELTEPILYKFFGSQDIENSCVLSTAHHFGFARNVLRRNCIPAQITEVIGNSPILFVGLSFLDPDFRLTYYTLLNNALDDINRNDRGYALQLPPDRHEGDVYRQMETGLWDNIKDFGMQQLGIKTIEEQNDVFLNKLIDAVRNSFGIDQ